MQKIITCSRRENRAHDERRAVEGLNDAVKKKDSMPKVRPRPLRPFVSRAPRLNLVQLNSVNVSVSALCESRRIWNDASSRNHFCDRACAFVPLCACLLWVAGGHQGGSLSFAGWFYREDGKERAGSDRSRRGSTMSSDEEWS